MEPPSQDSEGFVAPVPLKKKAAGDRHFENFCKRSEFIYRPMNITDGQKIRFVHEATMPSTLARKEQIRMIHRKRLVDERIRMRKNDLRLCR